MAVSSLAPKADAADASGVGMEPLPQGWGHADCALAYTGPWKVLRQGRAVASGTAGHSTNTPGMTWGPVGLTASTSCGDEGTTPPPCSMASFNALSFPSWWQEQIHHCWHPGMLRDAYLILGLCQQEEEGSMAG